MQRLKNIVGDWKDEWRVKRDEAKPTYLSNDVWVGLVAFWMKPESQAKSTKYSAVRMTKDAEGNPPVPHTSGQTPHAGRALQIVSV